MRVWDIASGNLVREALAGSEFGFITDVKMRKVKTKRHFLKLGRPSGGGRLLITELLPGGGVEDIDDDTVGVAYFTGPQTIISMRRHGTTICVGCEGGAVCILRARFLAV